MERVIDLKSKKIRRLIDYLLDTLVTNLTIMTIIIPYYKVVGMDWHNLKMVITACFTIGWVQSFPISIVLRWFRRHVKYLEVS